VVKPSPAFDTMAPPTDALEPIDGDELDATTGAAARSRVADHRRVLVIGASAAIALLAGAWLWGFATSSAKPSPDVVQAGPPPAARAITVEPIPVEPRPVGSAGDPPRDRDLPEASSGKPAAIVAQPSRRVSREIAHRAQVKPAAPSAKPAVAPPAPFTRGQLGQKFQQVRREYDDYKAKFGSRLEREWGELATFIQYTPASDDAERKEAARRLDSFRVRMRE
jgi:hypothetical protein